MTSLSYFEDIDLSHNVQAPSDLEEVPEPEIKYPGPLWPNLSPVDSALRFLKEDFDNNLSLMATKCTESITQAKVLKPYGTNIFVVSLNPELRKYLIYQGTKLYNHKQSRSKMGVNQMYEIGTANSEFGTSIFINIFSALCGFEKRVKPDFDRKKTGDLGDFKIGAREFDVKHRYINDYKAGWFTDIDFSFKEENTIGIYTLPRGNWEKEDYKNADMSYDVSIMGGFDNSLLVLRDEGGYAEPKAQRGGVFTRKVLDTKNMLDLKKLLRVITSEILREEGKL